MAGSGCAEVADALKFRGGYGLRIFIFISKQNSHLIRLTRDSSGLNLPIVYGPWQSSTERPAQAD